MTNEKTVTTRISHRFGAAPERVFDAWLDAGTVGRWLFATPTGEITKVSIDPRVGGHWSIVRREGHEIGHCGEYLQIDRPHRLAFTFGVPRFSPLMSRVTVEIVPQDGCCELALTNEGVLAEYEAGNIEGWTMILGKLAESL